jgi:hypothetical protein
MPDGTQDSMRARHWVVPGIAMVPPAGIAGVDQQETASAPGALSEMSDRGSGVATAWQLGR